MWVPGWVDKRIRFRFNTLTRIGFSSQPQFNCCWKFDTNLHTYFIVYFPKNYTWHSYHWHNDTGNMHKLCYYQFMPYGFKEIGHHWFRHWVVACSAPKRYCLNQWRLIDSISLKIANFSAAIKQRNEHACPFVCHTIFTMFLLFYHEIFSSNYHWQKGCPCKISRSEVKGQGQRGQNKFCHNLGISGQ